MTRLRLAFIALFVLVLLATLLVFAPANWLAIKMARASDGRIVLADAQGTLWHGSAVLGFGGTPGAPARALALPGRMRWDLAGPAGLGARFLVTGEGIAQPLTAELSRAGLKLLPGSVLVPCEILDTQGGLLQTLALRCQAVIGWQALSWPEASGVENSGTILLSGVSSALAAVKPLGDYRIDWRYAMNGILNYQVSTASGALLISGRGALPGGFDGTAQISATAAPDVREKLKDMLATVGPQGPAGTLLKY